MFDELTTITRAISKAGGHDNRKCWQDLTDVLLRGLHSGNNAAGREAQKILNRATTENARIDNEFMEKRATTFEHADNDDSKRWAVEREQETNQSCETRNVDRSGSELVGGPCNAREVGYG